MAAPREMLVHGVARLIGAARHGIDRIRTGIRHAGPLVLIPLFGTVLLIAVWSAILTRLDTEREATRAGALRTAESNLGEFAQYTVRELRDIDRTAWMVKAQFEHDGLVNLPYLVRNKLVPAGGAVRVSVTDIAGNVIASNHDFTITENIADRDFFQRLAAVDSNELDITQRLAGPIAVRPVIEFSRRLNHGDGAFGGVVTVTVDPDHFTESYDEQELGPRGMLAMLAIDGVYRVRRSGEHIEAGFDGSKTPLYRAALANGAGLYVGDSVIDGMRRFIGYRKLADFPLIVAAALAEEDVMAEFEHRQALYVVTGVMGSLFILAFFATNTVLAYRTRRGARAVRRQKAFLEAMVDNMPVAIMARSMQEEDRGRIKVWNPAAAIVFGVPATEALGKRIDDILPSAFAADVRRRDAELLASPMVQDMPGVIADVRHVSQRSLRVIRAPIFDAHDHVDYVLSIIQDVTDEEKRAEALRLNAKVFETTADAIIICDGDDRVIAVNAAFTKVTGFASETMLGRRLADSPFRPGDPNETAAFALALERDGCVTAEVLRHRWDGTPLPCWLTKTCVRDATGAIANYVRVFTDISELNKAQKKLEQLANVDALTGLLNRRMFHERLEHALRRADRGRRSVALLFLDLDGFKMINDLHGHDAGDIVLREVASRLQRCVRATDSLCRLGGDEFTIIMEDAMLPRDAEVVAERMTWALDPPIDIGGRLVDCRASLGIALYPAHGRDAEALLKSADVAMYQAKQGGRHRFAVAANSDLQKVASEAV